MTLEKIKDKRYFYGMRNMTEPKIARVVQKLMDEHGDNQSTLAKKINFSQGNLSKMLKGKRRWTIDILNDIVNLYQTSLYYFFL